MLVWSLTVLTALVLRRSLRAILARLASFEGFGVKATLADAAADAAQVTGTPPLGKRRHVSPNEFEGLRFTPQSYYEVRRFATRFREGQPVLPDLSQLPVSDAMRRVALEAGLVFHSHGTIERVTSHLFLLTPTTDEPDAASP